jgi:putative membrane protein
MSGSRIVSGARICRFLLLLAYSAFVVWLAETDRLSYIVHPRARPWIIASGLLALLMGMAELLRSYSPPRRGRSAAFYVALPFAMAMIAVYSGSDALAPGAARVQPDIAAVERAIARRDAVEEKARSGELGHRIDFDDDRYWALYNRVYDDPKAAAGRIAVIQGFVYRQPNYPNGSLLVARNLMWCCSADMAIIGILASGEGTGALADGTWVEAEGSLGAAELDLDGGGKPSIVPVISIQSIRPVEKIRSTVIIPY